MRSQFSKATAVIILPFALFFATKAQAQSDIRGWDNKRNAEFIVPNVQTKIKVGQVGTVTRDVGCDCDLLTVGKTQDGKTTAFLTPAFFAQFNAESQKTWEKLPANVRQVLERSRTDKSISRSAVDGIKAHLETEHGISPAIVVNAAKRCKNEYLGL